MGLLTMLRIQIPASRYNTPETQLRVLLRVGARVIRPGQHKLVREVMMIAVAAGVYVEE